MFQWDRPAVRHGAVLVSRASSLSRDSSSSRIISRKDAARHASHGNSAVSPTTRSAAGTAGGNKYCAILEIVWLVGSAAGITEMSHAEHCYALRPFEPAVRLNKLSSPLRQLA